MKNAKEMLEGMINDVTCVTTRGTMGDADGLVVVDAELVSDFSDAKVVSLKELKSIKELAYEDLKNFVRIYCVDIFKDDFFVAIKDCQYLLIWEN